VASASLLVLLLLDLCLLLGLLVDRGQLNLDLTPDELTRFTQQSGILFSEPAAGIAATPATLPQPAIANQPATPPQGVIEPQVLVHVACKERGILPFVWRWRDVWWGGAVAFLFRSSSWLQWNLLALVWLLSAGAVLWVLRAICLRQIQALGDLIAMDAVASTRRQLHRQVLRIGAEDLDGTTHALASELFVNVIEQLRQGVFVLITTLVRYPLEILGLLFVLLSLDWRLALQWLAPLALGAIVLNQVRISAQQKTRQVAEQIEHEQQSLVTSFRNSRLIRGLGLEQSEHDRFQKQLERYHLQVANSAKWSDPAGYQSWGVFLIGTLVLTFLLFLISSHILIDGGAATPARMTIAEGITFLVAIGLILPAIRTWRSLAEIRQQLILAADQLERFLRQIPSVTQAVGAKFLHPLAKSLYFENVKFKTPSGRILLDGINFQLTADKSYAFVSVNPLEARAVAFLLPRFIEPQAGRILIDGEDIAWGTLESLRAETVFVGADDPLIEGTVYQNLCGGRTDLTQQQITDAAKLTHAHQFIVKLFNGYETLLTDEFAALDAGQRFRLSLARAVVRNPALLIIEEPSVGLDEDTKGLLVDAYDRICRGRTVIFLPRRMSTVRRTDQVVVLHEGKVAAQGPHAQLVTQSPVYRHWEYVNFHEYRHEV